MGLLFERAAAVRRPLSRATASLGGTSAGRGRRGAEFLAELLDFRGAVELSRALEARPAGLAPAPPPSLQPPIAPAPASLVPPEQLATVRRLLDRAEREARRPLDDRQALLSAARIDGVLQKLFARPARRHAVTAAAREAFAPLESRVRERVVVVRRLARDAREEAGGMVAASGPTGARLEQLDAALHAATAARVDALFVRAVAALAEGFAVDMERTFAELPRPARGEPVGPWAGASKLAADHVARCESFVVAVFQHERMRIDMLVSSVLGEATS